jgi:arylsulfatase A
MSPATMPARVLATSILGLTCMAGAAPDAPSRTRADEHPNIIYILADDLGYGELGCYGQEWIRTPNIDQLAAEGIRFTQHYAGAPVCAPSRCMLMTGMHPGHAYIRDNGNPPGRRHDNAKSVFPGQHPIPDATVTVAESLKQAGYATAAIGKWGLGYEGSTGDPNNQGFDLFFGFLCQIHAHNHYPRFLWRNGEQVALDGNDRVLSGEHYSQDLFIDEATEFIREHADEPFFVYLPFAIPHLSIQVPDASVEPYLSVIPEEEHVHRGYLKHPTPRAGYAAMITHMDEGIGQIVALVEELGLEDDTLIIFASDNGPTYDRLGGSDSDFFESAGPFRGRKGSVYEGGIRVPMVARWTGHIEPGTVTDHISAFWDVMPTMCDLAGVPIPDHVDGISFAPTLLGEEGQAEHDYLYWEFPSYGHQQAVRFGQYKAVRRDCRRNPNAPIELYDLANDIDESEDIAAEHPDLVEKAWQIIDAAHVDSELFPFPDWRRAPVTIEDPTAVENAIPKDAWSVVRVTSESTFNGKTATMAIDGDPSTWWHSKWRDGPDAHPHEIVIDLGARYAVTGLTYLPRQDGSSNGTITRCEILIGDDPALVDASPERLSFDADNSLKRATWSARSGRYVMLRTHESVRGQPFASAAELGLTGKVIDR